MRIRAVVDVIEAGKVLLMLGPNEDQVFWPQNQLPPELREGDIVYIDVQIDHAETEAVREENRKRYEALVKRTQEMERGK